ncbi:hypothetical protein OIO90_004939 [Microbotryomycetes sp. JL221]|nr:hypothetical protein OIO90_004939 [Microbotryomycetes sp. JL221]
MSAEMPCAGEIVSSVRSSCSRVCERSGITINETAIKTFLETIEEQAWSRTSNAESHGIRLPLRFDSTLDELNIVATLALLNFLSGYRIALKRLTDRGAWDNILALVLASHLSADDSNATNVPLSTRGMQQTNVSKLAQLMNIRTHVEKDHPTLGSAVKVGEKDEEAFEVLELLEKALRETGEALQKEGKRSFGEWVRDALVETEAKVEQMLEKIIKTFTPFRDALSDP